MDDEKRITNSELSTKKKNAKYKLDHERILQRIR